MGKFKDLDRQLHEAEVSRHNREMAEYERDHFKAPLPSGTYMPPLDVPGVGKLTDRSQKVLEEAASNMRDATGMTKAEYARFHKECCDRMHQITLAKNADYTGDNADPFYNFTLTERFGVAVTEQGFFVRMTDKFSRIASFIKLGVFNVKEESVEDTLLDLANYCILFAGYLRSKRQGEHK